MFGFGKHKKEIEINEVNENFILIENIVYKKHDEQEEKRLTKIIERELQIIDRLTKEHQKPILTLSTIVNNKTFIMADITLTLGGTPLTGVFTLLDAKDGSALAASFSNQAIGDNSNPEFATFALDASNNVIPTAIAAGAGTIVLSSHADYIDKGDGSSQSQDFTVTKNFTVVAGAPGPNGAVLDIVFS